VSRALGTCGLAEFEVGLPLRTASAALLGRLLSFAGWGSAERRFKPAAT
jgi:hypothetical protein